MRLLMGGSTLNCIRQLFLVYMFGISISVDAMTPPQSASLEEKNMFRQQSCYRRGFQF